MKANANTHAVCGGLLSNLRIGSKSQRNRDGIVTIIWSVEQEKIMKWD